MVKCYKSYDEYIAMEWSELLSQTVINEWNGQMHTLYVPAGADRVIVNQNGTYTIEVNDLRMLLDNLHSNGISLKNIRLVPSLYLNSIQGYNSIILYRGWFCRVDSCGRVILCTEQVAYDKGLLAK